MAKKKKKAASKPSQPRSFAGIIRGSSREVQAIAKALRAIVVEELPRVEENYMGGQRPMAMYRTMADVCWIQPLKDRCNIYFTRGADLTDEDGVLEGTSERMLHAKIRSLDDVESIPVRAWIQETEALNAAATRDGLNFDQVMKRLREICLALPDTKETTTWGKPHFRVGEKIFCGCGEDQGLPKVGLKMQRARSEVMMKLAGIEKAAYSRKGDGWVSIDPNVFDEWEEIETFVIDSYRLIAPKRTVALLDSQSE